ncbi:MAG: hypothetical protein JJT89_01125 [Nitriliruptoraceae bacterium]|nr:hypothetical protein [Nitriliruptoraceae bacterium]
MTRQPPLHVRITRRTAATVAHRAAAVAGLSVLRTAGPPSAEYAPPLVDPHGDSDVDAIPMASDARFAIGSSRSLAQPATRVYVRPDQCVDGRLGRYGRGGWTMLIEPARAVVAGQVDEAEQNLTRYYADFRPRTLGEALFPSEPALRSPLLESLDPSSHWVPWLEGWTPSTLVPAGSHVGHGPNGPHEVRRQVSKLVEAARSLRTFGYQPDRFVDGYIQGYVLVDGPLHAFRVSRGHHRLAVISAMLDRGELDDGCLRAGLDPVYPRLVDLDDLPRWRTVMGGDVSRDHATELFRRTVAADGAARQRAVSGGIRR